MDDIAWSFLECMKMETPLSQALPPRKSFVTKNIQFLNASKLRNFYAWNQEIDSRAMNHNWKFLWTYITPNHHMWTILSVTKNSSTSLLKPKFKFKLNGIRKRDHMTY